ncbi:MAG: FGGY-family carbohydrate kinase [Caldilineaceae bacterium]
MTAMRLIGGGGKSSLWPQILADCFGLPIQLLELKSEATSWGAAVIGGVAVGLYDWSIAAAHGQVVQTVAPDVEIGERYAELVQIYADTYAALKPIYERLQ